MNREERVARFKESGANQNQIFYLNAAIDYGLQEEELDYFQNTKWDAGIMKQLLDAFKSGMELNQVKEFMREENGILIFNTAQIEKYIIGYQKGLSKTDLRELFDPAFNARTLGELIEKVLAIKEGTVNRESERLDLMKVLNTVQNQYERICAIERSYEESQKESQEFIAFLKKENGEYKEKENKLIALLEIKEKELKELRDVAEKKEAKVEEDTKSEYDMVDADDVFEVADMVSERQMEEARNTAFSIESLRKWFQKGDEERFLQILQDKRLTEKQREQIRLGMENGLTIKDILQYAKADLSAEQMKESRLILMLKKQKREGVSVHV